MRLKLRDVYTSIVNKIGPNYQAVNTECRTRFIDDFSDLQVRSNWKSILLHDPGATPTIDNIKALKYFNLQDNDFIKLMVLETVTGPHFLRGLSEYAVFLNTSKVDFRYNITSKSFKSEVKDRRIRYGLKLTEINGTKVINLTKVDYNVPFNSNTAVPELYQDNSLLLTLFNPEHSMEHIRMLLSNFNSEYFIDVFCRIEVDFVIDAEIDLYNNIDQRYNHMVEHITDAMVGYPLFYLYQQDENSPKYWVSMDNAVVLGGNHFKELIGDI